jgi:hypothetical protein
MFGKTSRFTYGISIRRSFKEGVDPEYKKRELVDGYVDKVFDKHVEIGQVVKVGEHHTGFYWNKYAKIRKGCFDICNQNSRR